MFAIAEARVVLKMFLIYAKVEARCSYKIVLIKKRILFMKLSCNLRARVADHPLLCGLQRLGLVYESQGVAKLVQTCAARDPLTLGVPHLPTAIGGAAASLDKPDVNN